MKCESCDKQIQKESTFCNFCGHKQKATIAAKYSQPYGAWQVTTEGDCEGRSIQNLGTHIGYIDDIARALSPSVTYALRFKSMPMPDVKDQAARKQVSISFDYDAGFTSMSEEDRANTLSKILRGRPVRVERGDYHGSVKLIFVD